MNKIILLLWLFLSLLVSCKKDDTTVTTPSTPATTIGKYTLDGQVFNCKCFSDNQGYVFLQDNNNTSNSFSINRMPTASTGSFSFGTNFTGNTVLPMGYLLESRSLYNGYGSESGTITKTASREFTFQCTLYNPLKTVKYQISGSGQY